ncbi:MAG: hypothetical protein KDK61_07365, partial [Simkania sp.]|nr:hypothetical protein [Simkania sp.]
MKFCLILFTLLWMCSAAVADEVTLKNGEVLKGDVMAYNKFYVEIKGTDGRTQRKPIKQVQETTFSNKLHEEYFQKMYEAEPDVEKVFLVADWAGKKLPAKYQDTLKRCLELNPTFDKAGQALGYKKDPMGRWAPSAEFKKRDAPNWNDLTPEQRKKIQENQGKRGGLPVPDLKKPGEPTSQPAAGIKLVKDRKATSAWKKVLPELKRKRYEKAKTPLEEIAKTWPNTEEGQKAQELLAKWDELLEDRELEPLRRQIKIVEFTIDFFQPRTLPKTPELRLEFDTKGELDELTFRFWACKRKGAGYVVCRSAPKDQTYYDIEEKKGHKMVCALYIDVIPQFVN